jgi:glycosyltransferase involved in cell wall biosynthesis
MKVLHVYRTCYPETKGGLEQVIRFIASNQCELGVETKVLALTDGDEKIYNHDGYEIILVKKDFEISSNGFSFKLIKKFRALSKWADIINYHYPWPSGDLLSLFSNKNTRSVVTYHSDIVRQKFLKILYHPLMTIFLNNVDKIIATSPQYASSSKILKKYINKVEIIPLGIDENTYPTTKNINTEKIKHKYGSDFVLFVGVLRYYKGLSYLLDAAKMTTAKIIIAGDGPLKQVLLQKIENEKIDNVIITGFVSETDKYALFKLCKVFVFPSHLRSEAFGISLLEAQLYKKPIISCEVETGSSYVNQNNITGFIINKSDPKEIARVINILIKNNQLCKFFGDNGYNRLKELFTSKKMAVKYHDLYCQLITKPDR